MSTLSQGEWVEVWYYVRYISFMGQEGYEYSLLFSPEERRFVRPIAYENQRLYYRVKPDIYLVLSSQVFLRPPKDWQTIKVSEVAIYGKSGRPAKEEELASIYWRVFLALPDWTRDCPSIIVDFVRARPPQPQINPLPNIDWDKVYPEEEVKRIIEAVESGQDRVCRRRVLI